MDARDIVGAIPPAEQGTSAYQSLYHGVQRYFRLIRLAAMCLYRALPRICRRLTKEESTSDFHVFSVYAIPCSSQLLLWLSFHLGPVSVRDEQPSNVVCIQHGFKNIYGRDLHHLPECFNVTFLAQGASIIIFVLSFGDGDNLKGTICST